MASLSRSGTRRAVLATLAAAGIAIAGAGVGLASTPVIDGYRDHPYGGGAFRPAQDKPQSKLWFTDGSWFAGMFLWTTTGTPRSEYRIWRLNMATHSWTDIGTIVDTRDTSHADYLWEEGTQTLTVVSVPLIPPSIPTTAADDGIKIFRYTYNATTNAYAAIAGFPKVIPGTATVPSVTAGGAPTVTIDRDSNGRYWVAWPRDGQVRYSISDDLGVTWSPPAQVPVQAPNPIRGGTNMQHDSAAVIAFGSSLGIAWSDHSDTVNHVGDGFWFAHIAAGADPTMAGNWTLEQLPTVAGTGNIADNHVSIKATADGRLYMVGKTGKDTLNCATAKNAVLVEAWERTAAGAWTAHLVGTVGDCNTRPHLVLSEELQTAFIFLTSPNGGGVVYRKSAPLSGPEKLKFRGVADQTFQPGTPFIRSATETLIDDPSTSKQSVTAASGIVVIANNITSTGTPNVKVYMHGEMLIATADAAPPTGTVMIDSGAATTTTTAVSLAVPATDPGSGVSLVRVANAAGGPFTTFAYTTPIAWTLPGGDGTKTVYVQWRDSKGNWSAVANDQIILDTAPPTGTVAIDNGAATTVDSNVTLNLTTSDGGGSGTTQVIVANTADFAGAQTLAYGASVPWTLAPGQGVRNVYVKFVDAAGHQSAAVSDSITVTDGTPPTAPGPPIHRIAGPVTVGIATRLTWTPGTDGQSGVGGYVVERQVDGGAWAILASPNTNTLDLQLGSGHKWRFRVKTRDNAGNLSTSSQGVPFWATSYNESSSAITYTGTWTLSSNPNWFGGKARYATAANATASFRFTGNQVGWLARRGPNSGVAKVYVNNVLVATINLYAPAYSYKQLVWTAQWGTSATRTVKIVVAGTAGHPLVPIDEFFVYRP